MSAFEDMRLLKEEEKWLIELQNKLRDQLNRLKVEELALLSDIRNEKIRATTSSINEPEDMISEHNNKVEDEQINSQALDLDVNQFFLNVQNSNSSAMGSAEEEEEMEEEEEAGIRNENDYHEQLTYFSFN